MAFDPPLMCPWRCHEIGGPWIAENPSCPFHGSSPVDLDELDPDEGERMCREQEAANREDEDRYLQDVADSVERDWYELDLDEA